jgi:catechol 2,3-dioxygenase-like lactoylglutathione lyase family enzyme
MTETAPQTPTPGLVPAIANHLGLTTPDIFATIDFYETVLGFRLIMGPRILEPHGPSPETRSVFGLEFHRAYQAHLLAANGFGIEIFQFVEPTIEPPEASYRYTRRGWSHICLTVPDVGEAVKRIIAAGGERLTSR